MSSTHPHVLALHSCTPLGNSTFTFTPPDSPREPSPSLPDSPKNVAKAKRADRESLLQRFQQWRIYPPPPNSQLNVVHLSLSALTECEKSIVALDATAIVQRIASREFSSFQVTVAFCKTAIAAQDLTNCLTEIFFQDALKRAADLDQHLTKTGSVVGPLHGLPVSIKDHILVRGQVRFDLNCPRSRANLPQFPYFFILININKYNRTHPLAIWPGLTIQ
jgi:hypothetical protein